MCEHTKGELSLNNYHYPHAYLVIRKGSEDNDAFPRPRKICDVTLDGKTEEEYEANAKRLVRCWNSHDKLLAACKLAKTILVGMSFMPHSKAMKEIKAAIAKAKGA